MTKAESGNAGFTLLEVMVATGLFVTGMTLLIAAYGATLGAIDRVQLNQSLEQDLALVRERVLLLDDPLEVEEGGEVETGQHGTARWSIEYEPTQIADLFAVTLEIEWDPSEEESSNSAIQSFYLVRPTWSDPVERAELRTATQERFVEKQMQMR